MLNNERVTAGPKVCVREGRTPHGSVVIKFAFTLSYNICNYAIVAECRIATNKNVRVYTL